jgi:tripartite motif-containing protein 71
VGKEKEVRNRVLFITATLALAAVGALADYVFGGYWGTYGLEPGSFRFPSGVAVAPNGYVYVSDGVPFAPRVQYFTSTGSFVGCWSVVNIHSLAVGSNGNVYTTSYEWGTTYATSSYIRYFSPKGTLLGSWIIHGETPSLRGVEGIATSPGGRVFVANTGESDIRGYARRGRFIRKWGGRGTGPGEFNRPRGVAFAPTGRVYVADTWNHRVQIFTDCGTFLGQWGKKGRRGGEFDFPQGIAVAPATGYVYVADTDNNRVEYFTADGVFIGGWGSYGQHPGEFSGPEAVAVTFSGNRVYVVDSGNNRIQYFNRNEPAVLPASLGCVKALFR